MILHSFICTKGQTVPVKMLNESHQFAINFIDSCESGNYNSAKINWNTNLQYQNIDPRDKLWIAHWAFKNRDTTLCKKILTKLISQNGFILTDDYSFLSFYESMSVGKLKDYYLQIFKKENKEYCLNNIDRLSDLYFLDELYRFDQSHTIATDKSDSCCEKLTKHLKAVDRYIYEKLLYLSIKYNYLPNNFDFKFDASGKITIMIQHLFYDSTRIESVWQGLLPFYEQTFKNGKMTNDLIYIYDKWLNIHFHYQYYGTIMDVRVIDEANLSSRQKLFLIK